MNSLVKVPGAGPANVLMPTSWGSHASKIVQVLLKGHNKVRLDAESFDRLVTWIDINAPYYPSYASAYEGNKHGRSPLNNKQLQALGRLTGATLTKQSQTPQIYFTRPELSPVLQRLKKSDATKYRQALAIVQAGRDMLARRPRADMKGFQLMGIEAQREARYQRRLEVERRMRRAIVTGRKQHTGTDPRGKGGT